MNLKRLEIFLEFLVFGIVVGVIEDLIAVKVATGEQITAQTVGIVVLVAIPFAILGEIIVDRIDFVQLFQRWLRK